MLRSIIILAMGISFAVAQTTSSSIQSTSTTEHWIDPTSGGRSGNPGARIHISNKTIDAVHTFVGDQLLKTFQSMEIPNWHVSIGTSMLVVNQPKVTEMKFPDVDTDYSSSPVRVQAQFMNGKISATGDWSYRPHYSRKSGSMNGTYHATIINASITTTNQVVRGSNGKPIIQTVDCQAHLQQFKVEVHGAANFSSVEDCNDQACNKIRDLAEDAVCEAVRTAIKELINKKLVTFPNRILIQMVQQNKIELDYDLLNGEPKFSNGFLQTGLEGRTAYRGHDYVPFSPNDLAFHDHGQLVSFELSDFTFNSLFHQTHSQGHRFSVAQTLNQTSNIQEQLRLNCTERLIIDRSTDKSHRKPKPKPKPKPTHRAAQCLGMVFDNITSFGQHQTNVSGDLVLKSNGKAPTIFIQSDKVAYFDASNSILEVYGPSTGQNQDQRQLLARADVRVLHGEFTPKFVNGNFTGTVKITKFELEKGSIGYTETRRSKTRSDNWLTKLAEFASPLINDTINTFLSQFAQFPLPLLDGFTCNSPSLAIYPRSVQVDCDLRQRLIIAKKKL